jgi:soluble cytochrome b562
MTTLLKTIPRTVVRTTLDSMRLPLSTVERIAGQASNDAWPPALLFEDFQSNALQFVGGFLRDDELVEQGRLQAAKVNELRRAAELETQAEVTRQEANAKLERDRAAAERARERAEQQGREREVETSRDIQRAKTELAKEAREAENQVDAMAERRANEVAAKERRARLAAADAEAKALAKQQVAITATEHVANVGEKFEAKKRQRKSN